ncbi:hypothetical protein THAOC_29161, partial [Thalassiosira oceanica]
MKIGTALDIRKPSAWGSRNGSPNCPREGLQSEQLSKFCGPPRRPFEIRKVPRPRSPRLESKLDEVVSQNRRKVVASREFLELYRSSPIVEFMSTDLSWRLTAAGGRRKTPPETLRQWHAGASRSAHRPGPPSHESRSEVLPRAQAQGRDGVRHSKTRPAPGVGRGDNDNDNSDNDGT